MAILNMFGGGGGVRIPLEPVTGFSSAGENNSAKLSWTDPVDKVASPGGELVSQWAYTIVVRKQGSNPTSPLDGTVVVKETTRNSYSSTPYVDTGLTNGVTYYYGAYAYTTLGVPSQGVFSSAVVGQKAWYRGRLTDLYHGVNFAGSGVIGDYALVLGGSRSSGYTRVVNAYDSEFTQNTSSSIWLDEVASYVKFASTSNYGIAADHYISDRAEAYDSTLTHTVLTGANAIKYADGHAGCVSGTFCGKASFIDFRARLEQYDDTLTKTFINYDSYIEIANTIYDGPGGSIIDDKYMLMGNGYNSQDVPNTAFVLTSSLTVAYIPNVLSTGKTHVGITVGGNKIILYSTVIEPLTVYDDTLTVSTIPAISSTASIPSAASTNGWGFLFGNDDDVDGPMVYIFDPVLTLEKRVDEYEPWAGRSGYSNSTAVAFGSYVLMAGGSYDPGVLSYQVS